MFLHLKMTVTTAPPPWVVGPERQLPAPQTHTLPDHLPSCSAPATLAALLVLHLHRFLSGACPHVSISLLPGRLLASLRCPPLREGVPDCINLPSPNLPKPFFPAFMFCHSIHHHLTNTNFICPPPHCSLNLGPGFLIHCRVLRTWQGLHRWVLHRYLLD